MRHADRINAVVKDPAASGRSALFASWARSLTRYKLDPLNARPPSHVGARELRLARERMGPLLLASEGALDRLFQVVGGSGSCVLFTDAHGIPVERRGAVADDAVFRGWGLWTGSVWSEESEGTNGIGTCLAEARALTIHRDQHFYTRNIGLTCTVAPIHDQHGRLAGALDISSCRDDLTDAMARMMAAIVMEAARRIEVRHFCEAFSGARIMLAPQADCNAGALLAVGPDDLVIGATYAARQSCGITDTTLERRLPAVAILAPECPDAENLDTAECGVLRRALARSGGNVSAAAKALGVSRATLHRKIRRAALRRD